MLERERELEFAGRDGLLPFAFRAQAAAVVADVGVARMLAGHEHAARGRAHVVAGVMRGELHALAGEAVNVGRLEPLLAVTAQVAVAQVIGDEEDDVGFGRPRERSRPGALRARERQAVSFESYLDALRWGLASGQVPGPIEPLPCRRSLAVRKQEAGGGDQIRGDAIPVHQVG